MATVLDITEVITADTGVISVADEALRMVIVARERPAIITGRLLLAHYLQ
jgi:hypothetical protein